MFLTFAPKSRLERCNWVYLASQIASSFTDLDRGRESDAK
jgi:hypothetical protein